MRAEAADLVLHLSDVREALPHPVPGAVVIRTKLDLLSAIHTELAEQVSGEGLAQIDLSFTVSTKSGAGLDALLAHLTRWAAEALSPGEAPALTRVRHRHALTRAVDHLAASRTQTDLVLAAEDLRLAARALGTLTGRIDVEDVLDAIFRDFCIGK
jgi:tRNA modification GTPase